MPRLRVDRIVSVGAVAAGDNPEAEILFYKSKTDEPLEGRTEGSGMAFDLSHLTDEDRDPIQKHVDALEAQISELKQAATVEGEEEGKDLLPDDLPEPVAKALADRDAEIAKARTEAAEAKAEADKLRDDRDTEKYDARAAELENVLGPDMGPVLKALGTSNAAADYATLDAALGKLVKWEGMSDLLREHGDSAATGSAVDQIAAFAKEIQAADKDLTPAGARAQAWTEHPELKDQYREEGN